MRLDQLGEFGLINYLTHRFNQSLPKNIEGIGDDCAIIPYQADTSLLITTDLLIEDTHFLKSKISPEDLGYKSLAVNLSDIAAMGGTPLYAFLSIAFPFKTEMEWVEQFFNGLDQLAKEENVLLLGGDTTSSLGSITINILVIGQIKTGQIKRRSQAKIGDIICCTGHLGHSGAGLKVLLESLPLNEVTIPFVKEHHHPKPFIKEGQWLATQSAVHAMIDVSDGIDSDIQRIMKQSSCGADIDLDQLPISSSLFQAASEFDWNPYEIAITAGEDYCLLLTIDPKHYESLHTQYRTIFNQSLFAIGKITDHLNLQYYLHHQPYSIKQKGFDHFFNSS